MLSESTPFGGQEKTCSVSSAFMAENAETLVAQGMTEAQFSGAQAKGQLGVAFAKVAKGEIKKYQTIGVGTKPDGTEFKITYQGKIKIGKSEVDSYEVLKTSPGKSPQFYKAGENSAFLQQIMDEASWKFGHASKPTLPGPAATKSVGAMSDEDVAILFVKTKDTLAKEKGINIKGANPALDKEVHDIIGGKTGYTGAEIAAKIEAYKATGKKLSALKKKVVKKEPTLPPKPKPATVPEEQKPWMPPANDPFPDASDHYLHIYEKWIDGGNPGEIAFIKKIAKDTDGPPSLMQSAQKALHNKGLDWSDKPNGVPTQLTVEVVDQVEDEIDSKGLGHAYTDTDYAAQYIIAKDYVVGESKGKWTLYTQSDELDAAIFKAIKESTGQDKDVVKAGIANYLATGKKLSGLKKQLIKNGTLKPKAPTLKGGTKATKDNVDAFAAKGFAPKDYVPAKPLSFYDEDEVFGSVYSKFKQQPNTYLTSSDSQIYEALSAVEDALKNTYSTIGLDKAPSLLDILRMVDKAGAKKFGVTNEYLFEKKIVDWIASPQGKAYAQAKIDAAELEKNIPDLPSDSSLFQVISTDKARAMQDRMTRWTSDQKSALTTYTGGSYSSWNRHLRAGRTPTSEHQAAIDGMRAVDEDFIVHRGTNLDQFGVNSYEELLAQTGSIYSDKGFMSTSVGGQSAFSGTVRMEIEVPKGTMGAYVKEISLHRGENEFIVAPNTKFKILQVKKQGYTTVVRLRAIP